MQVAWVIIGIGSVILMSFVQQQATPEAVTVIVRELLTVLG